GRLRAPAARPRGARAGRPAAGRRHLHGRSRRPFPRGDDAALLRARAARAVRRAGALAGGPEGAAGGHERSALESLRDIPERNGGAGHDARVAASAGYRAAQAPRGRTRAPWPRLACPQRRRRRGGGRSGRHRGRVVRQRRLATRRCVAAGDLARSTIPPTSYTSGHLLRYVDPALATLLGEIPYASSATVTLGYRREDVPNPLDGFGFVVPRTERRAVLACTFSSVKYPG